MMENSVNILDHDLSPTENSSPKSYITSITTERKPNSFINQSVCGST